MYTPGQFAKRVGVWVKTIKKWDRLGILPAKRTITNRRYYTDEELAAALQLPRQHKPRATIAYCRVSSQAQKPDLQHQQAVLEKFCKQQAIEVDEWVLEIGGGLNFERKQFLRSEEHTSELQSHLNLVCRLLLEKKKILGLWQMSVSLA